jgi:hypothetical protein
MIIVMVATRLEAATKHDLRIKGDNVVISLIRKGKQSTHSRGAYMGQKVVVQPDGDFSASLTGISHQSFRDGLRTKDYMPATSM